MSVEDGQPLIGGKERILIGPDVPAIGLDHLDLSRARCARVERTEHQTVRQNLRCGQHVLIGRRDIPWPREVGFEHLVEHGHALRLRLRN